MAEITLPKSITRACQELDNDERNQRALNRILISDAFKEEVLNHKKQHSDSDIEEYTETLKILLSFYKAGAHVAINDLLSELVPALDEAMENRTISRTQLRDSFIPMLRRVGLIAGEKPLIWAYLDHEETHTKLIGKLHGFYQQMQDKTAAEMELHKQRKEEAVNTALAKVTERNRVLADDIKANLDYTKKLDAENRKLAFELGIPYSQVKEKMMGNKVKGHFDVLRGSGFVSVVFMVVLLGFGMKTCNKPVDQNQYPFPDTEVVMEYQNGMSIQENIWRERYIELYKQNGGVTPAMEEEMIKLSGEYMLTMERMKEIVSSIKPHEITLEDSH